MSRKAPKPPAHLSAESAEWFKSVVRAYELEPHHLKLLTAAAEAHDRMTAARLVIQAQGLTFQDRFGQPRARPEIGIERDSRIAFARCLRELNLDVSPPPEARIPRGGRY